MYHIATNAPDAYDYRTTRPLSGDYVYAGRYPCRVVTIDEGADAEYQAERYRSGLYIAVVYQNAKDLALDDYVQPAIDTTV